MHATVTKLLSGVAPVAAAVSTAVKPQQTTHEKGSFQVAAVSTATGLPIDPGGAATGGVQLQGRLSPEAPWSLISSNVLFSALSTAAAAQSFSVIVADVKIMPEMRTFITGTVSVAALTGISAWLVEG